MSKPQILQVGPYPAWDEGPLSEAFVGPPLFRGAGQGGLSRAARRRRPRHRHPRRAWRRTAAMIAALPELEIISVYGVGYDAVDLGAARARGIRVTNTPDVLTKDVADLGVAMMLALSRGMVGAEGLGAVRPLGVRRAVSAEAPGHGAGAPGARARADRL